MIEPIPGEHRPVALWVVVAAVGTVAVVAAAYLAMASGRDAPAAAAPLAPVATSTVPSTTLASTTVPAATVPAANSTGSAPAADCPPVFEVRFGRNSAEADRAAVNRQSAVLAAWLSAHPDVSAVIDGHSDASGAETSNLQLSYQRATLLATALTDGGVPAQRVQARGYGEYQPMVGEPPDSAGNRRATAGVPGYEACPLVATIGGTAP